MIDQQRSYWNGLSDEYQRITRIATDDFHYGPQIPGERALRLLPPLRPGLRALELGCGGAQNSVWLAKQGADCTAMDVMDLLRFYGTAHPPEPDRQGPNVLYQTCPLGSQNQVEIHHFPL